MTADRKDRDKASGRFKPGQSGNRLGRPRKPKTVGAAITVAFAEKVPVNEGGRRRKITKLEAAAKQIANKSASGDPRSAKLGLELAQKAEERESRSATSPENLSETDQQIADRLIARLRQIIKEQSNEHQPDSSDTN
jgi:hypothetical protein